MLPLTKEELKSYQEAKVCYISGKEYWKSLIKIKIIENSERCNYAGKYRGVAHSICNLKFNVPNEITVFFIGVQIMIIVLSLKN